MFKRLRIAVLLYVLLFVAAAQFFTARNMTDWDAPLWVDIYTVAGDDDPVTRRYIDNLSATEFADAEAFFAREAKRYGVTLEQPFKIRIVGEHTPACRRSSAGRRQSRRVVVEPAHALARCALAVASRRAERRHRRVRGLSRTERRRRARPIDGARTRG